MIYTKNKPKNTISSNTSRGFTIIEALIAIFILSISVASMLGVTATSASYARYANNETTANYLLQEAVDSIRNSRDTIAFQNKDDAVSGGWDNFLERYGSPKALCFSNVGCYLKMELFDPKDTTSNDVGECYSDTGCPMLLYDENLDNYLFYNYTSGKESIFKRTVKMKIDEDNPDGDEVKVTVTVEWNNGSNMLNTRVQTLEISLLNWIIND